MKLTAKAGRGPILCSTFAAAMLFTLSASAQGQGTTAGAKTTAPPTTTTSRTADYVEQKEVGGDQVIKFTGDELAGENGAPGSSLMIRVAGPIHTPLIRPRLNFIPELLKSVENL